MFTIRSARSRSSRKLCLNDAISAFFVCRRLKISSLFMDPILLWYWLCSSPWLPPISVQIPDSTTDERPRLLDVVCWLDELFHSEFLFPPLLLKRLCDQLLFLRLFGETEGLSHVLLKACRLYQRPIFWLSLSLDAEELSPPLPLSFLTRLYLLPLSVLRPGGLLLTNASLISFNIHNVRLSVNQCLSQLCFE